MRRGVALTTLGCKLNQYDSEMVLTQLRAAGFKSVADPAAAELCIVNTCSVTANAERKARYALRSMHRRNPLARLMAIGCMAERVPQDLAEIPGVSAVLGNKEKERIVEFVGEAGDGAPLIAVGGTTSATKWTDGLRIEGLVGHTRAFLKVQDGCSQFCTYCIVPRLRGRGRSLSVRDAVDRARRLADNGYREIVITGVALGTYGDDVGLRDGLAYLLEALEQVNGIERIRLGSVEPWAVNDAFLKVVADSSKICPHLHIPLQSCSDAMLRRMNRRYTVAAIAHLFEYAFSLRSDWGFGSDIISGFPGESSNHHLETVRFLDSSPLSYLHVFPYSARPGTAAVRLSDSIEESEISRRVKSLRRVDGSLRTRFRKGFLGSQVNVMFENRFEDGLLAGHTENYLDVFTAPDVSLIGRVIPCIVRRLHPLGVVGEVNL